MRPSGSPKALERRRFRAIALLKNGLQPVEVAKKLKVSRRSVRRWKADFQKRGPEAIKARPSPGRPPKLNTQAKKELEKRLLKGAKAAEFPSNLWTYPQVAKLIYSCFGILYHSDHIGRLLHSLGWITQKPHRKTTVRNEEKIQQ